MNHMKNYLRKSFWQSEGWKNILLASGQALHIEKMQYEDHVVFIEFRSIGIGRVGAFSLGVDTSIADKEFYQT